MKERELLLPKEGARKEAILALTPRCEVGAEIGADHGITSAYLLRLGICGRMVVADISAASLDKARRLFALHGLEDRADFRVADGLDALTEPVGAIVIAGMGSLLIQRIIEKGISRIGDAALILQPNLDLYALRKFLMEHGFFIDAERLVCDKGRCYVILRARQGDTSYTEKELLLGPCLLRERNELWVPYLRWRRDCLKAMRREDMEQAIRWIEEEIR